MILMRSNIITLLLLSFVIYTSCNACAAGTYYDDATSKCVTCDVSCSSCLSSTECTDCLEGFFLYYGSCFSFCNNGYYYNSVNSTCLACDTSCSTCSSSTRCLSCRSGNVLLDGNCRPEGACPENCIACDSATTCQSCITGYYTDGEQCLQAIIAPSPTSSAAKNNSVATVTLDFTVRYDISLAEFNKQNGLVAYLAKMAKILKVKQSQIVVKSVKEGSVIIDSSVSVQSSTDSASVAASRATVANMNAALNQANNDGSLSILGVKALSMSSSVTVDNPADSSGSNSKAGLIAGLTVGLSAAAIASGAGFYFWKKKRSQGNQTLNHVGGHNNMGNNERNDQANIRMTGKHGNIYSDTEEAEKFEV